MVGRIYYAAKILIVLKFLRTMVHNDLLKRMFLANGYDVHHVMNITDVGHLTNEDDDSEVYRKRQKITRFRI